MEKHISVLLNEAIEYLNIKEDGNYIDATLGYAGHSKEILKRIPKGFLLAFDKDIDAIKNSDEVLSKISNNYKIVNTGFINIKDVALKENFKVNGVLFDLGISSPEIDETERGFSYMKNATLDMRMDQSAKLSAYDVVNTYPLEDLVRIFRKYGEEKHARSIANEIVNVRLNKNISTTFELVDIIDRCYPYKEKRNTHPAKKVFQALRIEVNNELGEFEKALTDCLELIEIGSRIVVITFHSLEDKICKNIFKEYSKIDEVVKGMPNIPDEFKPKFKLVTNKPITPSPSEINNNKRSKSAKMRVIEKIR
ncbi:MAG: 16S rRNA (cytosine(1402)-N(4))-methyltransferase RsmH [bacterium]|nr:16S rRNA (cytosine(1402)-N(4))-methyltransferase RsmH [bacterium]